MGSEIQPSESSSDPAVESRADQVGNAARGEKGDFVTKDAQHGVQAIEATASVWGKSGLVAAYAL